MKIGSTKCHICKENRPGFIGVNRMWYCSETCYVKDLTGEITKKETRKGRRRGRKIEFGLPRYLQPKRVHNSVVGVGGK